MAYGCCVQCRDATSCSAPVIRGHLGCLRALRRMGRPWTTTGESCIVDLAVLHDRRRCLEWVVANGGCPLHDPAWIAGAAAFFGSSECLRWHVQRGGLVEPGARDQAALNGCLRCLRLTHCAITEHPLTASTMKLAAAGGHLACVKWLRKKGCPWDAEVCKVAAKCGHLDVLQWLHSHGCPWNIKDIVGTLQTCDHLPDVKEYVAKHAACPGPCITSLVSGGQFTCLDFRVRFPPESQHVKEAAERIVQAVEGALVSPHTRLGHSRLKREAEEFQDFVADVGRKRRRT